MFLFSSVAEMLFERRIKSFCTVFKNVQKKKSFFTYLKDRQYETFFGNFYHSVMQFFQSKQQKYVLQNITF